MSRHSANLAEIVAGLKQAEKMISPKFFYDERGSQLFDQITDLPEYYLTETEIGIMLGNIGEIIQLIGRQASLIEFGSGSSLKTRILLQHLRDLAVYVPVDISEDHLLESARQLRSEFPETEILPLVADFMKPFDLPEPKIAPVRNIVYFPGSTIGNLTNEAALDLLKVMRHEAKQGGALLIGVDLQKSPEIIERAYNDSDGITAEFNLNLLQHLNREFGANFDIGAFSHQAKYNRKEGRVEIRLINEGDQTVAIGGEEVTIADGEGILTEYSHKYTLESFAALTQAAGFAVEQVWTDDEQLFSVQYCITT